MSFSAVTVFIILARIIAKTPIANIGSEIDKYRSKKRLEPDLPLRQLNPVISVPENSSYVALASGGF